MASVTSPVSSHHQSRRQSSGLSPPQTPSTPTATRGLNPLSSKVSAVLSISYADSEFRDALSLLDNRQVENTAETRRQLRLDLQKEVIDGNGEIINDFGRVAEQLRKIKSTLDTLNNGFREMTSQIDTAHAQTSSVLEGASSLIAQKKEIETKQQLLTAFRDHFILSEDEVAALTLSAEPLDDRFFLVLAKAKKISKDCEILLGLEKQTLGLELMEQTSKNLNLAFQKLYRWIQREFKTLNLENPHMNASIRRALRVLAERPSLFQNCLDFFAEARERILSDAFCVALTGASTSGIEDRSVKPIEMTAHDPLRYVGDMLAWAHSATVSEREALESLFIAEGEEIAKGLQSGRANELWRLVSDEDEAEPVFDAVKELNHLVDRDVSGAARILRQRIEQVIQSNEETILSYKLANLLNFYRITFSKLLGERALLLDLLVGLEAEALRQFRSLMRDYITTLRGEFQQTPSDLGPPDFLQDALKQLVAIMKTYETSLAAADNREADFEPILKEAFEPFMVGCENVARAVDPPADAIFLTNCLLLSIGALKPFEFTQARVARLRDAVANLSNTLIRSQYIFLREGSGMDAIFEALLPLEVTEEDVMKMQSLPAVQVASLAQASQVLDDFLPSALMDAMENIKHLQDAKLAREITEEAAEKFCGDFEHVEEMLICADGLVEQQAKMGEEGQDTQALRAILPRTTGEIRVLLS